MLAIETYMRGQDMITEGNVTGAAEFLRSAFERFKQYCGDDNGVTLQAEAALGMILLQGDFEGKLSESAQLLGHALVGLEKTMGMNSSITLQTRSYFGWSLQMQRKFNQAAIHLRAALEGQSRQLGPEATDVCLTQHFLGKTLLDLGNYPEARLHLGKALKCYGQLPGRQEKTLSGQARGEEEAEKIRAAIREAEEREDRLIFGK